MNQPINEVRKFERTSEGIRHKPTGIIILPQKNGFYAALNALLPMAEPPAGECFWKQAKHSDLNDASKSHAFPQCVPCEGKFPKDARPDCFMDMEMDEPIIKDAPDVSGLTHHAAREKDERRNGCKI